MEVPDEAPLPVLVEVPDEAPLLVLVVLPLVDVPDEELLELLLVEDFFFEDFVALLRTDTILLLPELVLENAAL